jgi:hypothetical protein
MEVNRGVFISRRAAGVSLRMSRILELSRSIGSAITLHNRFKITVSKKKQMNLESKLALSKETKNIEVLQDAYQKRSLFSVVRVASTSPKEETLAWTDKLRLDRKAPFVDSVPSNRIWHRLTTWWIQPKTWW